jgi:hypothetical protein
MQKAISCLSTTYYCALEATCLFFAYQKTILPLNFHSHAKVIS